VISQEAIDQRRFQGARPPQATSNAQAAMLRDIKTRYAKMAVTGAGPPASCWSARCGRATCRRPAAGTPWFRLARDSEIELAAQLSDSDPGQYPAKASMRW